MTAYREVTRDDWKRTLLYIFVAAFFVGAGGVLLAFRFPPLAPIIWILVSAGGAMIFLVRWHAGSTAYECSACGTVFEISALTDFVSPHMPTVKYLKCPNCGVRRWTKVLMKE